MYKTVLKFEQRNKTIEELEYVKAEKIESDIDLLYCLNCSDLEIKQSKKIDEIISFHVKEYKALLIFLKKQLNLDSVNELLKLIINRDEKVINFLFEHCSKKELEYILAALVVHADSCCFDKKELVLYIELKNYEAKDITVHEFFKIYKNKLMNNNVLKYPAWHHFAKLIFEKYNS